MRAHIQPTFDEKIESENQRVINEFLEARKIEVNISKNTQILRANTLKYLSRHTKRSFKNLARDDIISFLNSLRKTEVEDPNHRWIGTYNLYLVLSI